MHSTVLPISTFMCLKLWMKKDSNKCAGCTFKSREPSNNSESYSTAIASEHYYQVYHKYSIIIDYHTLQTQLYLKFYLKFTVTVLSRTVVHVTPHATSKLIQVMLLKYTKKNFTPSFTLKQGFAKVLFMFVITYSHGRLYAYKTNLVFYSRGAILM